MPQKNNIIYCGMADDIMPPLLLVPNFDKLFVICLFDAAFAKKGTWEGQKSDILEMLARGDNKNSFHREVLLDLNEPAPIYYLKEPCTIHETQQLYKCWKVRFNYKDKTRWLVYYHDTDFLEAWPENIQNISHVMSMGAEFPLEHPVLNKMLRERTTPHCKIYDSAPIKSGEIETTALGREIFIDNLYDVLPTV